MEGDVQWTVTVSKETDAVVRTFLAQRGMNRRTLASFVEDAVRWRMFSATEAETKGAQRRRSGERNRCCHH